MRTASSGFVGILGLAVAGLPRLRARCCAARTRPTGLSAFWHFPASYRRPIWGRVAESRLALPGGTGPRSSESGPREAHRIAVFSGKGGATGGGSAVYSRAWAGPEGYRLPFPCRRSEASLLHASAYRIAGSVPSNPSLQRTRLRSPLNSISLGRAKEGARHA